MTLISANTAIKVPPKANTVPVTSTSNIIGCKTISSKSLSFLPWNDVEQGTECTPEFSPIKQLASNTLPDHEVRTIKKSLVTGETAKTQTINVWNGNGVSISFYQVNETVQRVWIDDPSQILIDTDGCLQGIDQNCPSPGAGLIHLRKINKINVPGLPQSHSTLLTIVTQTAAGTRKAYLFRVIPSNSHPRYSEVSITEDELQAKNITPRFPRLVDSLNTIIQIRAGINFAISKGWLKTSDELRARLENLMTFLQNGDPLSTAANKANVSLKLVDKLIHLSNHENRKTTS